MKRFRDTITVVVVVSILLIRSLLRHFVNSSMFNIITKERPFCWRSLYCLDLQIRAYLETLKNTFRNN
jgi:hypothetical protein